MGSGSSVSVASKPCAESDINKIGKEDDANAGHSNEGRSCDTKTSEKEEMVDGGTENMDESSDHNNDAKKIVPTESLNVDQTETQNFKGKGKELFKDGNVMFDFTDIDAHAMKAPQSVCGSTRELAGYLMKDETNKLLIARSFYKWITENIRYDTESLLSNNRKPVDAESVLRQRTSVCAGYANLFQELCIHAGIDVKVISGYSKGSGYDPETPFDYQLKIDHAWNVLNIDNKWRFVECTWGAGHFDNQGEIQKEYNDFYFLTDPKHFINAHFPYVDDDIIGSKQWQLLEKPFTLEKYGKAVKLSIHAMKWGLNFSHNKAILHVDKTLNLKIMDNHGKLIDLSAHLLNSDEQRCYEYLFLRRLKTGVYKVTIRLLKTGIFRLEIYGKVNKEKEKLNKLVTYILKCQSVDPNVQPYPKHSGLWGVDSKAYEIGFEPSIGSKILHKAVNGELKLELPAVSVPESMLELTGASGEENLERYSLLETNNNGLQIQLRLPRQGFYKLKIFSKTGNSTSFQSVMTFLIKSFCSTPYQALPFPKTFSSTRKYFCELMDPTTAKIPANLPVVVRFKSPKLVTGFVDCMNYTDLKKTGDVWEAKFTTSRSREGLTVFGNDTGEETCRPLYRFDIV